MNFPVIRTSPLKAVRSRSFPFLLAVGMLVGVPGGVNQAAAQLWGPWLWPNLQSPHPVGAAVPWFTLAFGFPGPVDYRFSVSRNGGPERIIRDYHFANDQRWLPLDEGQYVMRVDARNRATGTTLSTFRSITVAPRTVGGTALVAPTDHPLVALYCIPPSAATEVRVRYRGDSETRWNTTHWKPCPPGESINFLVAGLVPGEAHTLTHEFRNPVGLAAPPQLRYRAGLAGASPPSIFLADAADERTSDEDGFLIHSVLMNLTSAPALNGWGFPFATDLQGRVRWYFPVPKIAATSGGYVTRTVAGGTMLLLMNDLADGRTDQFIRETDLLGNTVGETTGDRINEQLLARGEQTINGMTHEAVRLPNGHTLVLASIEKVFQNIQGQASIDLLGDMVVALDENWQVVWTWNSFEKLDLNRPATIPEDDVTRGVIDGTLPIYLAPEASDWTHGNTITYVPEDGNILVGCRSQDMIYKVDYRDGTGDVIWRFGKDGDFTLESDDPWPWFSHQHQMLLYDGNELVILDNGNTRCKNVPNCNSRGQVYRINEQTMEADLVLNVDLGDYARAFGSSQRLSNGNYHWLLGIILEKGATVRSIETDGAGLRTWELITWGLSYRTIRAATMYEEL